MDKKLRVLAQIAQEFHKNKITWAAGASLLLYFKGIVKEFHDLDIMVTTEDSLRAKDILLHMGTWNAPAPHAQYRTKYFYEFEIDGVEIDLIGGFRIVKDGIEYDCSLRKEEICEFQSVNGQEIPLQSLSIWRHYYDLMGRTSKVEAMDRWEGRSEANRHPLSNT